MYPLRDPTLSAQIKHQIRAIWFETNPITFLNPWTIDSSTINKNSERALHAARLINTKWNLLRVGRWIPVGRSIPVLRARRDPRGSWFWKRERRWVWWKARWRILIMVLTLERGQKLKPAVADTVERRLPSVSTYTCLRTYRDASKITMRNWKRMIPRDKNLFSSIFDRLWRTTFWTFCIYVT